MFSRRMLLCALTLTLLAVTVESFDYVDENNDTYSGNTDSYDYFYDYPVSRAERLVRPLRSLESAYGPIGHSGVKMLLCAVTLTLLAVTVESFDYGENENYDEDSDEDVSFDSPVVRAEKVVRPLKALESAYGPISHSGVKVTLEDGSQWLIHKRVDFAAGSQMVVTSAKNMSPKWKSVETKEVKGRKTVADFVKAGGDAYDILLANCHHSVDAMMNL
ncbi:uncharacterized protein LOC121945148 isoform X2 [Plectropomus leopardus]|uniref:uncharacterized protein LOC121945148 isoform X2 n=1 Tax=Plectropomus leopardus TaxID=160734 RepID=UPI001C4A97C7|nr:uncharacterized protein LOC121945148 isoform X2 [Plectropomus leopardus]